MKTKVLLKKHQGVVAVCDSNLVGRLLEEGKLQLDISEHFYKGEEKTEKEIINVLQQCTNANLVGENAVRIGIKSGIISKDHVIKIKGIPHAQKINIT